MKELINRKKKFLISIILILELFFLIIVFKHYYKENLYHTQTGTNNALVKEEYKDVSTEAGKIIINRVDGKEKEAAEHFASFSGVNLPAGTYEIKIFYETNKGGNKFRIIGDNVKNIMPEYVTDFSSYLSANNTEVKSNIWLKRGASNFEIQFFYIGTDKLEIHKIEFQQNNKLAIMKTIQAFLMLLLFDLFLLFSPNIILLFAKDKFWFALLGLFIFTNMFQFGSGVLLGHDSEFHLLRMQGIKESLLSGQFPARIYSDYMLGYGYATGVLYPGLLHYFTAALLLIGMSLTSVYNLLISIINLLTIIVSYHSFKAIFKNRLVAYLGTTLFTLAPYRILDLYTRAALGEACAMIGFPLIAYGLYNLIVSEKREELKFYPLILGYTFSIQSHILSCIFVGMYSVIVGLIFIRRIITKNKIEFIAKMFSGLFAINAWLIIPLLDYLRLPFNTFSSTLDNGLPFYSLFITYFNSVSTGFGYASLLLCILFVAFFKRIDKYKKMGLVALGLTILSAAMSMKGFPWNKLLNVPILNIIIDNIQFAWRFLEMGAICIAMCGCVALYFLIEQGKKRIITVATISLCILCFIPNIYIYFNSKSEEYNFIGLDTFNVGLVGEYMIDGTDWQKFKQTGKNVEVSSTDITCSNFASKGTEASFDLNTSSSKSGYVDVPFIMYPGYIAENTTTGENYSTGYGSNNVVRVMLPENCNGHIVVRFKEPILWRISEIISIVSLLGSIVIWRRKRRGEEQ